MYNYEWDPETGGYLLITKMAGVTKELRPVFWEELDLLGFNKKGWTYPKSDKPLLWAETRRYFYKGRFVAEATGGGLFTAPELKLHEEFLELEPVNIDEMIKKNKHLINGLVQKTLGMIYETFNRYKKRRFDVFYVAFSGGKDSLVLLDLVQRAIPHSEFKVVFGDTKMEISDTYEAVRKAKERWDLDFYIAKSHYDAQDSWKLFAPPSRTQRWCCSVHKSAPSLLLLRKLLEKDNLKALVFDGIRAEESDSRATYSFVSDGNKHMTQSNCSPLKDWNTSELYLYILENDLMLNKAYRYGAIRVGCSMCPMASSWWEYIANTKYQEDTRPFIEIIDTNAKNKFSKEVERLKYINTGGWKGRMGGRELDIGGNRVIEQYDAETLTLYINEKNSNWKEWIKTIGTVTYEGTNEFSIEYKNSFYRFSVEETDSALKVVIRNKVKTKDSIRFLYLFKNIFNKVAYCVHCKVCMVECPFGSLKIEENKVLVADTCKHCENCIDSPKGCLVAKSLYLTIGGNKTMSLKGINRYQHFGFRSEWLNDYIELGENIWTTDKLGKYQRDGFKVWLKEAEITQNNSKTELGMKILELGVSDIRAWAVILNNLVYNSTIVRWYVQNIDLGSRYKVDEIVSMLGEDHSLSTRENAVTSLKETFKLSPIGIELGLGNYEMKGKSITAIVKTGWQNPDSGVILYSLFKFAEKSDGYYSFTLTELVNDNPERVGISPAQIFGIDKELLKRKIQGLAFDYPDFISVAFNKDLDNINLNKEKTSLDVIKLL